MTDRLQEIRERLKAHHYPPDCAEDMRELLWQLRFMNLWVCLCGAVIGFLLGWTFG